MICSWTRIENLVVPPVVEEGEDQVVLDCPFTFTQKEQEEEELLELKWYFNDSPAPFYQESPLREQGVT